MLTRNAPPHSTLKRLRSRLAACYNDVKKSFSFAKFYRLSERSVYCGMTDHEKMILISKVKGGLSESSGFYRSFATTKSCLFPFMIALTIRLSQDKKIASLINTATGIRNRKVSTF